MGGQALHSCATTAADNHSEAAHWVAPSHALQSKPSATMPARLLTLDMLSLMLLMHRPRGTRSMSTSEMSLQPR